MAAAVGSGEQVVSQPHSRRGRPKRSDISDKEVFEAVRRYRREPFRGRFSADILAERWPYKVVLAKMQQMVSRGLLEYGVSVRTAWIVGEESKDSGRTGLVPLTRELGGPRIGWARLTPEGTVLAILDRPMPSLSVLPGGFSLGYQTPGARRDR